MIIQTVEKTKKTFREMLPGEVFAYGAVSSFYMKLTSNKAESSCNAVSVQAGCMTYFNDDTVVEPKTAVLMIK